MKAIAQTFLVGMGVLGLLVAVPGAIHTWLQHRNSGGDYSGDQIGYLLSPLLCCAMVAIGLAWQKQTKKSEPRRSAGHLTEDGAGGDSGGGDGD
jgi:hypothetical protein